jgi:hypothetical protein
MGPIEQDRCAGKTSAERQMRSGTTDSLDFSMVIGSAKFDPTIRPVQKEALAAESGVGKIYAPSIGGRDDPE